MKKMERLYKYIIDIIETKTVMKFLSSGYRIEGPQNIPV